MNQIVIISKKTCAPCQALLSYVKTLPESEQEKISVLDSNNTDMEDIYAIMQSYESSSFPTLIFKNDSTETVVNGFGPQTCKLIRDFLT